MGARSSAPFTWRILSKQRCLTGLLVAACGAPGGHPEDPSQAAAQPTLDEVAEGVPLEPLVTTGDGTGHATANAPPPLAGNAPAGAPMAGTPQTGAPQVNTGFPTGIETTEAPAPSTGIRLAKHGLTRGKGDDADRQLALGDAAVEREQFTEALGYYRSARRLIPEHPAPLVGIVLARMGAYQVPTEYATGAKDKRVTELLSLLDSALKLDAEYPPAVLQYGRLLLIQGQADRSLAFLERAVTLSPRDAEAHSARAVVSLATGDKAGAVRGFQIAAELDPNSVERITNLGTALMLHGDVQQAITQYQRAASLEPGNARAQGDLGTALLATGNARGALSHLTRAHELAPTRATFMSNLGYAYQQLGELPTAIQWYQRAIASDRTLGSAWINLGTAHAAVGDRAKAEAAFKQALALDPTDPRAQANLQELGAAKTP
jgi:Flp pilus assembly protein TadD